MLNPSPRLLVWIGVALAAVLAIINALCMIVSPKLWFELPEWLAFRGVLTKEKYSNSWGGVQVRILGSIILITVVWVAIRLFLSAN